MSLMTSNSNICTTCTTCTTLDGVGVILEWVGNMEYVGVVTILYYLITILYYLITTVYYLMGKTTNSSSGAAASNTSEEEAYEEEVDEEEFIMAMYELLDGYHHKVQARKNISDIAHQMHEANPHPMEQETKWAPAAAAKPFKKKRTKKELGEMKARVALEMKGSAYRRR